MKFIYIRSNADLLILCIVYLFFMDRISQSLLRDLEESKDLTFDPAYLRILHLFFYRKAVIVDTFPGRIDQKYR